MRIHFTTADLGRVRLATVPDRLWEVVGSAQLLATGHEGAPFQDWIGCVRERLRIPSVRQAAQLITRRICLDDVVSSRPNLTDLASAVRTYDHAVVRPHSAMIENTISLDRVGRTRDLCAGGVEGLLSSFSPVMVWHSPVLDVHGPTDAEVHLRGSGLRLVPSFFCWPTPKILTEPGAPPVVLYPVGHPPSDAHESSLAALLGTSRAAVLGMVGAGHSTSEVARLVGISLATASHHTTVLRAAGLVATQRDAHTMVHALTPLGEQLLYRAPV